MIPFQKELIKEGSWTPSINTHEGVEPTVTYEARRGNFQKIGGIVFIDFYIKGKITALNGSDNYACITGLPFNNKEMSFGTNALSIGTMYGLIDDNSVNNNTFVVHGNKVRIQGTNGSSATQLKVTSGSYFEVAGSGFYVIDG